MSPSQRGRRLADIADRVTDTLHLVKAGKMATEALDEEQRAPLFELLHEIVTRLQRSADDIHSEMADEPIETAA